MAKTFREWNVERAWLLPSPSVLDSVPADHIAHFVRDTVREQLDLTEPAGLSHGERFSQAARGGAAGAVLQLLKLYQRAGLVTLGNVALDGTKVRGNASKHSDELCADARGLAPFVAQISTSRVGRRGSSPSMPAIVSEGNIAVLDRHHIDAYIATASAAGAGREKELGSMRDHRFALLQPSQ